MKEANKVPSELKRFCTFVAPVTNRVPQGVTTLPTLYKFIKEHELAYSVTYALQHLIVSGAAKGAIQKLKGATFPFVTFSSIFEGGRSNTHFVRHTGLLCLDIDGLQDLNDVRRVKHLLINDPLLRCALIFSSPSWRGVKAVLAIDADADKHLQWFRAIESYLLEKYGIQIDSACKDVTRVCYIGYDNEAYLAPNFQELEQDANHSFAQSNYFINAAQQNSRTTRPRTAATKWQAGIERKPWITDIKRRIDRVELNKVLLAVKQLKARKIDITEKPHEWIAIGLAFANTFREAGRGAYHLVSSVYPRYTPEETDVKYDELLRSSRGEVTLGTFYHYANIYLKNN